MARKKSGPKKTYGDCTFFEQCGNQAVFKNTQLCGNCYHSIYYHLRQGVAHVMKWGKKLSLWSARQQGAAGGKFARRSDPKKRKRAA